MLVSLPIVTALLACFDGQGCFDATQTRRGVRVAELDEFPLTFAGEIGDDAPRLYVWVERLDTGETTEEEVALERVDERTFTLPEHSSPPLESFYGFSAPRADDCDPYDVEILVELRFPEDWPVEIRSEYPPETVRFLEDEWPIGTHRSDLVCLGSDPVTQWCFDLDFV